MSTESTNVKSNPIYTKYLLLDDLKNKLNSEQYSRIIYSIEMIEIGATTWDKNNTVEWLLTQYKRFNLTYTS